LGQVVQAICPKFDLMNIYHLVRCGWVYTALFLFLFSLLVNVNSLAAVSPTADDFQLQITHPVESQVLYAGAQAPQYVIPVKGFVKFKSIDPTLLQVQLEIYSGKQKLGSGTVHPAPDGFFSILVTVNPEAKRLSMLVSDRYCEDCHNQETALYLPSGEATLIITALEPSGQKITAERHIVVEQSGWAQAQVKVIVAGDAAVNVQQLPIIATTQFAVTANSATNMQSRYFKGFADASGQTQLQLESFRYASTAYRFYVPPTVIDGFLISSTGFVESTLAPGATVSEPITVRVQVTRGQIAGQLNTPSSARPTPFSLRAIDLVSGRIYTTTTTPHAYVFSGLPIGQYLILLDSTELRDQKLTAPPQLVDLTEAPIAQVDLNLEPAAVQMIHGVLRSKTGEPLLFGWVIDQASGQTVRANLNGEFSLPVKETTSHTLSLLSPGYWGQVQVVEAKTEAYNFVLAPRSDVRELSLEGNGKIFLPTETIATVSNGKLDLSQGWVWGTTGSRPYELTLPGYKIVVQSGSRFSLERQLDQTPRLYVFKGKAQVTTLDHPTPLVVETNQMLALSHELFANSAAMPIDSTLVAALYKAGAAPLTFIGEPTLEARVRDGLARLGIGAAQTLTFVTYSALYLIFFIVAVLGSRRWLKRYQKSPH